MAKKNTSLDSVCATLDQIAKNLDVTKRGSRVQKFALGLRKPSYEYAAGAFASAEYPGTNDVNVREDAEYENGTCVIRATGDAVAFIEFGTGVTYDPGSNPLGSAVGAAPGVISAQGAGFLNSGDWWIYRGEAGNSDAEPPLVRKKKADSDIIPGGVSTATGDRWWTRGNPPAKAMYYASELVRTNLIPLANQYLKDLDEKW